MRRLQIVTHSAWTANILTMLHRIWDLMMKCFHAVRFRKLTWIYSFLQLAILQVKTSQTLVNNGNSDLITRVLAVWIWQKNLKNMRIMCADAGLSLTPHVQVYLCLRCCHKCRGQKERIHDEFKHPSIFGVPALLFTVKFFSKNKIRKNDPIFILIRIFPCIFIK